MLHDKGPFRDISHVAVWDVEDLKTRAMRTSEEFVLKLLQRGTKQLQKEGAPDQDTVEEDDLDEDLEEGLDDAEEDEEDSDDEEVALEQNYAAVSEVFRFLHGLTLTDRAAQMLLPFESGPLGDFDRGRGGCGFIYEQHDLPDGKIIVIALDFEEMVGSSRDPGELYSDYFTWFLIDPDATGTVESE